MQHPTPEMMKNVLMTPSHHAVYPFIDPKGSNLANTAANKTVFITGAGSGIGRAITQTFATAGAARIAIAARRSEPLEETKSLIAASAPDCKVQVLADVDVTDLTTVQRAFGSLDTVPDVVIHNAGVSLEASPVADSDPMAWWGEVDMNLKGCYNVDYAFLQLHKSRGRGKPARLINLSSSAAWRMVPGRSSYSAAKVGVNSLSEYVDAEEVASGSGVRCVAIHPGGVNTGFGGPGLSAEIRAFLIDEPELAAGTALWLCGEGAEFLMGRYVDATWDMEALEGLKERVVSEDLLKTRVVGLLW